MDGFIYGEVVNILGSDGDNSVSDVVVTARVPQNSISASNSVQIKLEASYKRNNDRIYM